MNITEELYQNRQSLFLKPSGSVKALMWVLLAIGVATIAYGFSMEALRVRTWGAILLSNFFFFSLALGGVVFGLIQELVGAHWGRPIRRIPEGFGKYMGVSILIFAVMFICIKLRLLGAGSLYSWINDPNIIHHFWGKNVWLQEVFMLTRDFCALFVIYLICLWYYRLSLRRDHEALASGLAASRKTAEHARAALRYWAAPILFLLGILYSLLAFDLTMSLAPTWFSTLWGGWSFAVLMQTMMATILIFMFAMRKTPIGKYFGRQQYHDVGKLMHGFTVFFAYLTYAHVLTYWFANMPETSEYYIHRLHQPWLTLIIIAPIFNFVLPLFVLIPKASKWTAKITIPVASMILAAQWLTYIVIVTPNVVKGEEWMGPTIELGVFLGIIGAFLMTFMHFAQRNPMISLADPLLPAAFEHH